MTDQEIINNLANGGLQREKSATYLINKHIPFVSKIKSKTGLNEEEALMVYSDAIVLLIDQIVEGKFEGKSKISTYFYQIYFYKSVDHFRKKTTQSIERDDAKLETIVDPSLTSYDKMEISEEFKKVQNALTKLGQPCKDIILQWGYWGYSMEEIAQKNKFKTAKQAKDRKYKCLQKLKKTFKDGQK